MEKFGKSQPVRRREDLRFLTGHGRYVDDIVPEGALFGYVVRSSVAHGKISNLDLEDARHAAGVHMAIGFEDLVAAGVTDGMDAMRVPNRDGTKGAAPFRPILAKDRVRFVGEPIAFIVADTLDAARDAGEMVLYDIDELPVHLDLAPGGEALHEDVPANLAFDWAMGDEDATQAAFAAAAHHVTLEVVDNRIIANSLEPRGCYAEWDGARLHTCVNGQGVWGLRRVSPKF